MMPRTALTLRLQGASSSRRSSRQRSLGHIIEYRPVYVTGDVAKPGEQRYTPGLSVRQAVSLAGGSIFSASAWKADPGDCRTARRLRDAQRGTRAGADRLCPDTRRAGRSEDHRSGGHSKITYFRQCPRQIVKTEQELLNSRRADFDKEKAHLQKHLEDHRRTPGLDSGSVREGARGREARRR